MKVAICSVGELFGGVERHILGMCTWMMRQDRNFILVLFHDRELAKQARELGVEPVILDKGGSFDLRVPYELARVVREHHVDLIHAHGYKAVVTSAMAKKWHDFKIVRTVHGLVEPRSRMSTAGLKSLMYSRLEQFCSRDSQAAVCYVTEDLRRYFQKADRGLPTQTVYNGIDPINREGLKFRGARSGDRINLLAVGRISQVKGLDFGLDMMTQLMDMPNVHLDIVGSGPLSDHLENRLGELGLEDRVRLLGFKADIYKYMARADVLIMPSLHEGLPYTVLEAMSLGLVVVGSSVGGLREILLDGETGLLFPVGDVEAMTGIVRGLVANPEKMGEIATAAQIQQERDLTLDCMGSAYWSVFEKTGAGKN